MKLQQFLSQKLAHSQDMQKLFELLFLSVERVSDSIDITKAKTDNWNDSGDQQLEMDVLADVIIHDTFVDSDLVGLIASEERPEEIMLNGDKFSVVYDPLDGSSLIDSNFAIGTIFGVFEGTYVLGRTPRDMVAAMYAVYGPRTSVVMSFGEGVYEFILGDAGFELVKSNLTIQNESKYFAPGNLRACKTNSGYRKLVDYWIDNQFTLRYSGGMVPDINHIFSKGAGIFAYPKSQETPDGKLRLLYECGPMAFLVEQAGGKATNGHAAILDLPISSLHEKTPIFIGSSVLVDQVAEFSV